MYILRQTVAGHQQPWSCIFRVRLVITLLNRWFYACRLSLHCSWIQADVCRSNRLTCAPWPGWCNGNARPNKQKEQVRLFPSPWPQRSMHRLC